MGEGQRLRCSAINAMDLPGEHYPVTIPHKELLYLLECAVFALAVAGDGRDN